MKKIVIIVAIIIIISSCFIIYYFSSFLGSNKIKESNWELQKNNSSVFLFNEANINYIKMGFGPPLILIHGGGTWSYSFRNNIKALSEFFMVYSIDIPGHGYSEIPLNWKYSLSDIESLIRSFMVYMKIDSATFVGNSWGGGWVIYFAEKNPEKVNKLFLIDASGLANSNEYDKSLWRYLTSPFGNVILAFVNRKAVIDNYHNMLFYNKALVTDKDIDEVFYPFIYRKNLYAQKHYQKNLDWTLTDNGLNMLKNVMIIWGRHDKYLPVEMANEYHNRIPNSKLYIIENASHLPHEENPNLVNKIIKEDVSSNNRIHTNPRSAGR